MHYLVVGLGNPGKTYQKSRHNLGFRVVDLIAEEAGISLSQKKFSSHAGSGILMGYHVLLLKPTTYMNLSGKAVAAAANYLHLSCEQIAVIHDDMDLALGRVHIKQGGGTGGHRGLRSMLDELGKDDFVRFRVGIGHPSVKMEAADYVLQSFRQEELSMVNEVIERTAASVRCWLKDGLTAAMNRYNPWHLNHGV